MTRHELGVRLPIHYLWNKKRWSVRKIAVELNISTKSVHRWKNETNFNDRPRNTKLIANETKKRIYCDLGNGNSLRCSKLFFYLKKSKKGSYKQKSTKLVTGS